MASIRMRNGRWQVQIRRKGHAAKTRSFKQHVDALAWARDIEACLDRDGLYGARDVLSGIKIIDLLKRYQQEELPKKRGWRQDDYRINRLCEFQWAKLSLADITSETFAKYRDKRLNRVGSQTVRHELKLVQRVLNLARREWAIPVHSDLISSVRLPDPPLARNRRLKEGERELLMDACEISKNQWLKPVIKIAISTGLRRGELLSLRWTDLDKNARTILVNVTKSGKPREIPLDSLAIDTLSDLTKINDRIFPTTASAIQQAWQRLTRRAGIGDLHFHDLRHEAISRFFEKGLSVAEVALISGHKDVRQLFRYTHLRAEDVAKKLQ